MAPLEHLDIQNVGVSLLDRSRKGITVFSYVGVVTLLLLAQLAFMALIGYWFEDFIPHYFGSSVVFAIVMVIYLTNCSIDPTAKITWLILVMAMPVFGTLLFLYIRSDLGHRALSTRFAQITKQTQRTIPQDPAVMEALQQADPGAASLVRYLQRSGCHPVYQNTAVTYFPSGEAKFEALLRELEQAQHFIYLEYFIIREGLMWGKVLEILIRKAAQGVNVRLMYDGTCEFSHLPHDYPQRLRALGIHCKVFAPLTPFVSTHYNYRDHRKILVIDGHTAFTGGVNLADEYINRQSRFGHWKDTAIMLQGDAVRSFTLMFLQMWHVGDKHLELEGLPTSPIAPQPSRGFVVPYGDCPLDQDKVGERVYMDLLNRAQKYVHIMSPYLILDGELETALRFAAERGVEVALILPGIPDKKIPYALAKTHYARLLESGVQIYEYTPGFVHAKVFVADGQEAVVGTINLDYRSLYHHFECAAYLWNTACIPEIEEDFQATRRKCRRVTHQTIRQERLFNKIVGPVAKIFAPLL